MTIPIMPGPFSFLQGAGQALGAYGEAQTAEQHYQNQLKLQQQQEALANANFLQKILNPQAFAAGGPGAAAITAMGGTAPQASDIYVPPEVQKGQLAAKQLEGVDPQSTAAKIYAGTPLGSDVAGEQYKAKLGEIMAGLDPEVIKNLHNIKDPGLVKVLNEAEMAQARASLVKTGTDVKQSKMMGDIYDAVTAKLPNSPFLAKAATFAAVGGDKVLAAQIEAEARVEAERMGMKAADVRTLNNTISTAASEYKADAASWDKGFQQTLRDRLGIDVSEMDRPEYVKRSNEILKDYTGQHGERPTPDTYMNYYLRSGGMSLPQYQQSYGKAMGVEPGSITQDDLVPREGETNFDVIKRLYVGGKLGKTAAEANSKIDASTKLTPEQKKEIKNTNIIKNLMTPKTDATSPGVSNDSMQSRKGVSTKIKVPAAMVIP